MKPFDTIFAMFWTILIGIFAGKQEWGWMAYSVSFLIVHLVDSAIEVLRERRHK